MSSGALAAAPEGAAYWVRWQVLLCALVVVLPSAAAAAVLRRKGFQSLPAADLWISCWKGFHPLWLLCYRVFVAVFMSAWLLRFIIGDGVGAFLFYTQWTFMLVIVYFVIAASVSAHGCYGFWIYTKQSSAKNEDSDELFNICIEQGINENREKLRWVRYYERTVKEKCVGGWGHLMQALYQTCGGAVLLTDAVFWGLLVPMYANSGSLSLDLGVDGMHSINFVFLLLDTVLNNMPFPWHGMTYFVFWSSLYVSFQWLLHIFGALSWWPYPFLDLAPPSAPLWYLAIAVVHIPCFFLYWLISMAKSQYLPRFFPNSFMRA